MPTKSRKKVEDLHRLSEQQEALLLHHLRHEGAGETPGAAGSGLLLVEATLRGPLEPRRFERAWRETLARHPALRASVHWRDLKHPVQAVAPEVAAPLELRDGRGRGSEALAELRREEGRRGLDLCRAPVLRLTLVRTGEEEHLLLWTCHHLLLDGWSCSLVLRELVERYRANARGEAPRPAPAPPFRDYAVWARHREASEARGLWAEGGLEAPGILAARPLGGHGRSAGPGTDGELELRPRGLEASTAEAWARELRITTGSLFLGCWGLALAEATGRADAAFAFTSSGRGAPIPGIESMVGMLAATLPMHARLDPEAEVASWFRQVFRRQQVAQRHEHHSLPRLLEAGGIPLRRSPFDTLLAFANYPAVVPAAGEDAPGELRLVSFRGDLTSGYPLTVAIEPGGSGYRLRARFDPEHLEAGRVEALLGRFAALAEAAAGEAGKSAVEGTLGELLRRAGAPLPPPPLFPSPRQREAPGARRSTAAPGAGTGEAGAAAPNAAEAQLARIWNDLLEVREVGVDDNFFELGGTSLLVPTLIERIRRDFGVELPLGAVFAHPTLRRQAGLLWRDGDRLDWPCLVGIRPGGGERPLYLVHGLGGEVSWFYNLAGHLPPELPLWGLQAPAEPLAALSAMACRYLRELRAFQPRGPYRLGGYCVGGGVAYEMARQLRAAGEEVELLALIDSVPQAEIAGGGTPIRLFRRFARLARKEPREIAASVADFGRSAARKLRLRLASPAREAPVELEDVLDMRTVPRIYHRASRRHFRAMRDYVPEPYEGDAWLFRTGDERFGEDYGWGRLVRGRLRVETVRCGHLEILEEPHVRHLGERITETLAGP